MTSSPDPVLTTALTYRDSAAAWHASTLDDRTAWRPSYDRFFSMLPAEGVVLDLGCGSGEDLPEFRRRGVAVIGLDISTGLLQIASRHRHATGRLVQAGMRRLPLANEAWPVFGPMALCTTFLSWSSVEPYGRSEVR